jgi:hypothetical protein
MTPLPHQNSQRRVARKCQAARQAKIKGEAKEECCGVTLIQLSQTEIWRTPSRRSAERLRRKALPAFSKSKRAKVKDSHPLQNRHSSEMAQKQFTA